MKGSSDVVVCGRCLARRPCGSGAVGGGESDLVVPGIDGEPVEPGPPREPRGGGAAVGESDGEVPAVDNHVLIILEGARDPDLGVADPDDGIGRGAVEGDP